MFWTHMANDAAKLRRKLGRVTGFQCEKYDAPPENVTTPSLEASASLQGPVFEVHVFRLGINL